MALRGSENTCGVCKIMWPQTWVCESTHCEAKKRAIEGRKTHQICLGNQRCVSCFHWPSRSTHAAPNPSVYYAACQMLHCRLEQGLPCPNLAKMKQLGSPPLISTRYHLWPAFYSTSCPSKRLPWYNEGSNPNTTGTGLKLHQSPKAQRETRENDLGATPLCHGASGLFCCANRNANGKCAVYAIVQWVTVSWKHIAVSRCEPDVSTKFHFTIWFTSWWVWSIEETWRWSRSRKEGHQRRELIDLLCPLAGR